jgi:hypothetical protein
MLFSKATKSRSLAGSKQAKVLAHDVMSLMRISKLRLAKARSLRRDAANLKDKEARLKQKREALALAEEANKIARVAQEMLARE